MSRSSLASRHNRRKTFPAAIRLPRFTANHTFDNSLHRPGDLEGLAQDSHAGCPCSTALATTCKSDDENWWSRMTRDDPAAERSIERIQAEFEELDRLGRGSTTRSAGVPKQHNRKVAAPRPPQELDPRDRLRPVEVPRLQVEPDERDRMGPAVMPRPPRPLAPAEDPNWGSNVATAGLANVEHVARQARTAARFAAIAAVIAALAAVFAAIVELAGLPPF